MIDLEKLNIDFSEYDEIRVIQEGSVATGTIKAFGLDITFECEGSLIGIKTSKDEIKVHHVYKTQDMNKSINDFLEYIRNEKHLK